VGEHVGSIDALAALAPVRRRRRAPESGRLLRTLQSTRRVIRPHLGRRTWREAEHG
jgi:hypothetical protein